MEGNQMKLLEIFKQSRLNNRLDYVQKELHKIGNLRAGSSGLLTEEGEIAGTCHRKAHLRSKGIDIDEPTEDKLIMFDLGYASEDIVLAKLKSALPEGHIVLSEEEIPIEWFTENGTKVTGRPDHVICEEITLTKQEILNRIENGIVVEPTRIPVLGLELKSVHSMWTARDVLFGGKPKLNNIIQAAHYMWKLDVPYKIVYTGYSQLGQGMAGDKATDSFWKIQNWPSPGQPNSEYIEYSYYAWKWKEMLNKKTGKPETKRSYSKVDAEKYFTLPEGQRTYSIKHIKQFEIVYDLKMDKHGRVHYKPEQDDEWIPTIIIVPDIERFFNAVSRIEETDNLGPRPSQIDTIGGKAPWSDCDYCPLRGICDSHEKAGYREWIKEVRKIGVDISQKNPQDTSLSKVSSEKTDKV